MDSIKVYDVRSKVGYMIGSIKVYDWLVFLHSLENNEHYNVHCGHTEFSASLPIS